MNTFLFTLLIGISLSMDAFSLSLLYGTIGISNKKKILLSIIVGIYHFIMPLIGLYLGSIITDYIGISLHFIVGIIFIFIGIEMLLSDINNENKIFLFNITGFLIFGLSVSIDSFTTGIGLSAINNNYIEVCTIFLLTSSLFTYLGLKLGNLLNKKIGKFATIIGGIILILLGIHQILG